MLCLETTNEGESDYKVKYNEIEQFIHEKFYNLSRQSQENLKQIFRTYEIVNKQDLAKLQGYDDKIDKICELSNLNRKHAIVLTNEIANVKKPNLNDQEKQKFDQLNQKIKQIENIIQEMIEFQKTCENNLSLLNVVKNKIISNTDNNREFNVLNEIENAFQQLIVYEPVNINHILSIFKNEIGNENPPFLKINESVNQNIVKIPLRFHSCKGYLNNQNDYHPSKLLEPDNSYYKSLHNQELRGNNDWIIFSIDDNQCHSFYLKYFKIRNRCYDQDVKTMGISIGDIKSNEWIQYKPYPIDHVKQTNKKESLEIKIDLKLIENKKYKFVKIELINNYGNDGDDYCKFAFYELELFGIRY